MVLTRAGMVVDRSAGELDGLRARFTADHCIRLPGLIEPNLLSLIQRQIETAEFAELTHERIGVELCMTHNLALSLLHYLTNDPKLFQSVQFITGCDRIGSFLGRVYRMCPGCGHYDSWHSDMKDHRLIGMSINLNLPFSAYEGGVFQLRERGSEQLLQEAPNTEPGSAILFRIAGNLEHRVTAVQGAVPKTAFAGWFVSEPEFLSLLAPEPSESAGGHVGR